jgi:hypothetical protein
LADGFGVLGTAHFKGKKSRHAHGRAYTTQDAYILSNMNIVIENILSSSNAK